MAASLTWGLEAEGYVVDVVDNGELGLWTAQEGTYDAIILDVMCPAWMAIRCANSCATGACGRRS